MKSHLTQYEPLRFPVGGGVAIFKCQACCVAVTREHINVWQWRSHDHIRASNTRSAQLCDKCKPASDNGLPKRKVQP
jgi:hypothetical protein